MRFHLVRTFSAFGRWAPEAPINQTLRFRRRKQSVWSMGASGTHRPNALNVRTRRKRSVWSMGASGAHRPNASNVRTKRFCSFLKELTEKKLIKFKCQFLNIVLELSILKQRKSYLVIVWSYDHMITRHIIILSYYHIITTPNGWSHFRCQV